MNFLVCKSGVAYDQGKLMTWDLYFEIAKSLGVTNKQLEQMQKVVSDQVKSQNVMFPLENNADTLNEIARVLGLAPVIDTLVGITLGKKRIDTKIRTLNIQSRLPDCKCRSWARTFKINKPITVHHPRCEFYNPEDVI